MKWAFEAHADSDVMRHSLRTLGALAQRAEFRDGIRVGSICSGWGVCEMVLEALNEKFQAIDRHIPKAWVATNFVVVLDIILRSASSPCFFIDLGIICKESSPAVGDRLHVREGVVQGQELAASLPIRESNFFGHEGLAHWESP